MLELLTAFVMVIHIAAGSIGLVSGLVAAFAKKGGQVHRKAGNIFFCAMMIMAVGAIYLGFVMPDQLVNVFIGIFAIYLVGTGWLAVRRDAGRAGFVEKLSLCLSICLCAPFGILSFQLATGLPPLFESAVPFEGPVLIAIYGFTTILAFAALGDAKVVVMGGITGIPRLSRHLWRMCLGLTLALGSGFTNGLARLLPGPYHVPLGFFLPQFLPVFLLAFWMIRVRWVARRRPLVSQ